MKDYIGIIAYNHRRNSLVQRSWNKLFFHEILSQAESLDLKNIEFFYMVLRIESSL
jgi:hypothetical protein